MRKKIAIALILIGIICVVYFLTRERFETRPASDGMEQPTEHGSQDKAGTEKEVDETDARRFQSAFSEMEDTGEYQRGPEDRDSPGAVTKEMFALMGRISKIEKIPRDLLLPTSSSREDIHAHMRTLRAILQYEALVKDGTATIEQKMKLYQMKKKLYEEKARQIESYRELNPSAEDARSAEKRLSILRERIGVCEEELRRL